MNTSGGYPNFSNLVIAMPLSGRSLRPEIMFAYHNMTPPMNTNLLLLHTNGWPVDAARNHLCKVAIEQGARYIFFMDEDVAPPSFTLRELIYKMEHTPDAAVIGGIYCLKVEKPEPLVFRGNGRGAYWDWRVGEFFEVTGLGMGCTLIRLEALKDIPQPWFMTISDISGQIDMNQAMKGYTEDLYFCEQVTQTKQWKIYADGSILCPHFDGNGKAYTLPPDSKPVRHLLVKPGDKKIVDIGCGENKYKTDEGTVIGVDVREDVHPDFRADFRKLPFATGEFDIVFSSHTLEHCPRADVDDCLDEWTRILGPDGELRLILPNIGWAADQIKKGIVDEHVLNVLYGAQTFGENFHKFGFTPDTLRAALEKRGLTKIDIKLDGYNIICRAQREAKRKKRAKR